jgi:hypothetical protein
VKQKALLAAVFFALVLAAFSQVLQPSMLYVSIRPRPAVQAFDPLRPTGVKITGMEMQAHSLLNKIAITNYSTKAVTSIEYGWRISAPESCADTKLPPRWDTATANVSVAPNGGEGEVAVPESLNRAGASEDLAAEARASNTPVVLVTVGLVKVTFADGSTWSDDEAVERHLFDNGRAEQEESCVVSAPPNVPVL